MRRHPAIIVILGALLVISTACTNKKVSNPLANVGSKQPDKVLFDNAMDALKHNKFDVARLTLQTLINTYPDSEYIARAKLGVGDSWYAEGGTTAYAQAELEYKDFITFFPNMPEAAEAQLKIANFHYQQMEKPDRDFTHAARAEEEYRQLILQFPDSKLVPDAKNRLLEVQEVLAEREYRIGRFYYLRESYPAAIARLRSAVDRYPLYSQADEALFLLGQSYEGQVERIRQTPMNETFKAKAIEQVTNEAAKAYEGIIKRYPLAPRAVDAKARLSALHRPVPEPTQEMIALNKKEIESRGQTGMVGHFMGNFRRRPDIAQTTKAGDPTLVDKQLTSATEVAQETVKAMSVGSAPSGTNTVGVEIKGTGNSAPPPTPPLSSAPASDSSGTGGSTDAIPDSTPYGELKPETPQTDAPQPAPAQVNEVRSGSTPAATDSNSSDSKPPSTASQSKSDSSSDQNVSSSRPKKKKGLKKIIPF